MVVPEEAVAVKRISHEYPVDASMLKINALWKGQPTAITEYDEPLVRRLIEKVTIYEARLLFVSLGDLLPKKLVHTKS